MEAVRVEATVQSNGRVILDDLPFEEGKQVEIIILESNGIETKQKLNPLKGSVLRYDDPFEPAAPVEELLQVGGDVAGLRYITGRCEHHDLHRAKRRDEGAPLCAAVLGAAQLTRRGRFIRRCAVAGAPHRVEQGRQVGSGRVPTNPGALRRGIDAGFANSGDAAQRAFDAACATCAMQAGQAQHCIARARRVVPAQRARGRIGMGGVRGERGADHPRQFGRLGARPA